MPASTTRSSVSATTSGGWMARLQQWPHTTRPREPPPEDGARDVRQGARADVAALVAVEVDLQIALGRQVEHAIEEGIDVRRHVGDGAEDPAAGRHAIGQRVTLGAPERVEADEGHRLQLDPAGPRLGAASAITAQLISACGPERVQVRAHRLRAVRVAARAGRTPCAGGRPPPTSAPRGPPTPPGSRRRRSRRDWARGPRCAPCRGACGRSTQAWPHQAPPKVARPRALDRAPSRPHRPARRRRSAPRGSTRSTTASPSARTPPRAAAR